MNYKILAKRGAHQNGWGMGHIKNTTLKEFWTSEKLKQMRRVWAKGDPDNELPCHNCIRMAVPRGSSVWWQTTGVPPKELDCHQALKGGTVDPYPQPDE